MNETPVVVMCAGTSWYLWNFRRNVISALTSQNWRVVLIAAEDESTSRLAALPGVEYRNWPLSQNGANPISETASLWTLYKLLKEYRPDYVFHNGIKANIYGGLACRFLKLPYTNNITGLGTRISRGDVAGRLLAKLYATASAGATAVLIQNEADFAFLKNHGLPARIAAHKTMGSGVNLQHFHAFDLPENSPRRFVFVGRLQRDKGIHEFVAAAKQLSQDDPGLRFVVVGDTRHTNTGAVESSDLDQWRALPFLNFVGRQEDVRPFLREAHALVMPSHGGEGMPKVILEAAACGRPVITTDVPGCRDAVADGVTGLIAQGQDASALGNAIKTIAQMSDSQLQEMSRAARARAEAMFSEKAISDLSVELVLSSRKA